MADEAILANTTGELFQPVRLHCAVFDRPGLRSALRKLRCVQPVPAQGRCFWLYEHEARNLQFKRSYAQLPKQLRPVVIGSFFPRGNDRMLLDVRSCERAVLAIPFFDKYLPRAMAKATEADIINKLFSARDAATVVPDRLFDGHESVARDPNDIVRWIHALAANTPDPAERFRLALEYVHSQARQPLPEIERFPIHFYEEGIQGFANSLTMRQMVAIQHWLATAPTPCTTPSRRRWARGSGHSDIPVISETKVRTVQPLSAHSAVVAGFKPIRKVMVYARPEDAETCRNKLASLPRRTP